MLKFQRNDLNWLCGSGLGRQHNEPGYGPLTFLARHILYYNSDSFFCWSVIYGRLPILQVAGKSFSRLLERHLCSHLHSMFDFSYSGMCELLNILCRHTQKLNKLKADNPIAHFVRTKGIIFFFFLKKIATMFNQIIQNLIEITILFKKDYILFIDLFCFKTLMIFLQ